MINNSSNYISLREAAEYSDYSQEYLSLRARQKKLKAIKIARNWLTTKKWINEYLEKVGKLKEKEKGSKKRIIYHKSHFIVLICLMVLILGCVSLLLTSPYFQPGPNSIINIIAKGIAKMNFEENISEGIRVVLNFLSQFIRKVSQNVEELSVNILSQILTILP